MKLPAIAGTAPFAHLLGFAGAGRAKAGRTKAEDDKDDDRKARRAEDDNLDDEAGDGDDEGDGKKGRRAEGSEREDGDEQDERDQDERDEAKGSKAKSRGARADDDEGEEEDEEGDDGSDGADMRRQGARSARLRERARCAAIFSDAAAGENPALAATLAFTTDMPRGQAVQVLRAGGVPKATRRTSLDERMARVKTPAVGASDAGPRSMSVADQIVAAGRRRRGEA